MARQEIDLTTPQPNGKMGEPTKAAWEKVNDMTLELYSGIDRYSDLPGSNMLINCGIPINQRGFAGGALAAGTYGYDRWKAGTGGCNITINPSTGLFNHVSGNLQQVIESPLVAWGRPLTMSVEDPSASITVSIGASSGIIPAGAGRQSITLTPTGSGNMTLQLSASGATYARPQLERGSSASKFDARSYSDELFMCQRYFEKSFPQNVTPGNDRGRQSSISFSQPVGQSTSVFGIPVRYKVEKRASPAVSIFSAVGNSGQPYCVNIGVNCTGVGIDSDSGPGGFVMFCVTAAGSSAGFGNVFHFTSEAEI